MMIHVSRNGEEIAVATREVAEAGIRSGVFSRDDWAWVEGCADWVPLGEMFPPPAPPPLPRTPSGLSRRKMLLIGAAGAGLILLFIVASLLPDQPASQYSSPTSTLPSRSLEPLEGQNLEAERTLREIDAEKPGYLKREDRTLIRAMIINDAKREGDQPWRVTRFDLEEVLVELHGATAIAVVRAYLAGVFKGQAFDGHYCYSRTWLRKEEGWRIVAGSVCALPSLTSSSPTTLS